MSRRFFAPQLAVSQKLLLSQDESRHVTVVMRAKLGDSIQIFDGRGTEATARICAIRDSGVELEVLERRYDSFAGSTRVTIATAVPKGERFDWLVEKATEIGVNRLIPLSTSRSVVEPGAGKLARLRRTIVESSKQCGRSELMELTGLMTWQQFVKTEIQPGATWIADHGGLPWRESGIDSPRDLVIVVGPEGGFTPREVADAERAQALRVSLGPNILRIETAAIVLAALTLCERGGVSPLPP